MNAGIEALLARLGAKREEMLNEQGSAKRRQSLWSGLSASTSSSHRKRLVSCCSLHTVLRMSFLTASLAG